ncbi:MAG: ATP-dependent zinc protease [Planctomycetales bacterium]|nr:ATP-dependent zinc protease [Planctomycetales bacterium]
MDAVSSRFKQVSRIHRMMLAAIPREVIVTRNRSGFRLLRRAAVGAWLTALALLLVARAQAHDEAPAKRVVGATAVVAESETALEFAARIDTGASTCSVHVEKWEIEDESTKMEENVGKRIRFLVKNHEDEGCWIERKIAELAIIKTSEEAEHRYKVPMTLVCEGVKKRVLVSLNDRAHMKYPMLVGRNFLDGDFLVDVSQ